ncbi:MAG: ABC-2 transporter permease [Bryobacteraceae bacterium]
MTDSLVGHLIRKDWQLYRNQVYVTMAAGAIALAVVQLRSEPAMVVGGVWFFISLIMVGTMLPLSGIVNERKKQNLAFLMSLPISSTQYTTSKLLSSVGMFLIPWLTLVLAAVLLVEVRGIIPRGAIPMVLILAFLPFVGFCLITAAALIGESEGWGIAANVGCSSSYGLVWYFLSRIPALMVPAKGPAPVWNSTALAILAGEAALVVLMLGLTYYFQSRKRDFI